MGVSLNGVNALNSGFDEAHVYVAVAACRQLLSGKVGSCNAVGDGSACHFQSAAYGLFLHIVDAEAHKGVAVGAAVRVDIIVGARCCRQRNPAHKE
ncbi:hypothetical protein [Prevotella pallens]|uniref:hypothetical protein n=1 Tax=Prevotella pallens TaxID=60133 RepID=UPI0023F1F278|nr:hypothetical protein [Prevotella pallens]